MATSASRRTLLLGKRTRYEGRVRDGVRSGLGTLYVEEGSDESDEDDVGPSAGATSALRAVWRDDVPHGPGTFTEPDGGVIRGTWHNGILRGLVNEEHFDGNLRFIGWYADGERHGYGIEARHDGGCLIGPWVSGALHGQFCAYLYPCPVEGLALVGEWRRGVLHRARKASLHPSSLPQAAATLAMPCRLPEAACHPALAWLVRIVADKSQPLALARILRDWHALRHRRSPEYSHWPGGSLPGVGNGKAEAIRQEPYESFRVAGVSSAPANASLVRDDIHTDGAHREGLVSRRRLAPGEVVAFYGGVRVSAGDFVSAVESLSYDGCAVGVGPPRAAAALLAEAEWGVPTSDGSWVWLPPELRAAKRYCASLGHHAKAAGWRANCELAPFEHPILGTVCCLRVLPTATAEDGSAGIASGSELTLSFAHLAQLPLAVPRPGWLRTLLASHTEDGYYAHVCHTPAVTLHTARSAIVAHGRLRTVQHGPWRVLWFDGVEQGMTYHAPDGELVHTSVGFDYQRTMVAAAVALVAYRDGTTHGVGRRTLVVGLGAGSSAVALNDLCGATTPVEVVEIDQAVLVAAEVAHGVKLHRSDRLGSDEVRGGQPRRVSSKRRLHVIVADACAYVARLPAQSVGCAILDAYDGRGRVPAHLQAEPFFHHLAAAIAPGGIILANLWYGTEASQAAADDFVSRLVRVAALDAYALPVLGHEKNRIFLGIRRNWPAVPAQSTPPLCGSGCTGTEALRMQLRWAADAHAAVHSTEPAFVETMRNNAETLRPWTV